jgi:preprotein translocase subunit SecY
MIFTRSQVALLIINIELIPGHRRVEKSTASFVKDYIRKRNLILSLVVSSVCFLQRYGSCVERD